MARSDMFFKATGQRTGEIFGEARDKTFTNLIEIVDWSWGMTAPTAVGGARTGRTLMEALKLVKRADKASTALMTVMKNNELLTTAVLSVRKSGGSPLPYYVVSLGQARIIAYAVQSDVSEDGAPALTEHLSLAFKTINIDYTLQSVTGGTQAATNFVGETAPE